MITIEQALNEIESIENQISDLLERILELSSDINWEVRYRAIEVIQQSNIIDTIKVVRKGLFDQNEIVRVSCLEFLGEIQDELSVKNIVTLLNDESYLVRGAAAISLAEIGSSCVIDKLLSRLLIEDDDEVKVPIYFSLYHLGQEVYLEKLLNGLNNEYYRVRCATANLLVRIINDDNKSTILKALSSALEKEDSSAASSSIKNAMSCF
jgi:HEAT repeat protein